jgi:hypothetical protein
VEAEESELKELEELDEELELEVVDAGMPTILNMKPELTNESTTSQITATIL